MPPAITSTIVAKNVIRLMYSHRYTVSLIAARASRSFAPRLRPVPLFFARAKHLSRISEISSTVRCSMPINAFCAALTRISSSSFA